MHTLAIKENDSMLIVAPHPDDECIGAGGLLALYPGLCTVIVLTDGGQGQRGASPEECRKTRKQEFLAEMRNLGIERYRMLEYEDNTLMRHTDCMNDMPLSGYSKIFVTGLHDGHPDHAAACLSVYSALRHQGISRMEIYWYEVHSIMRDPSHMLDISGVIGRKTELIRFHKSQLESLRYDMLAESMAAYRAILDRQAGRHIEAYRQSRPDEWLDDISAVLEEKLQKQILFYQILTRWMDFKIKGRNIAELLEARGLRRIAVYGYAELGRLLCRELSETAVGVAYVLDKSAGKAGDGEMPVYNPAEAGFTVQRLPHVDAAIVTAVYYFEEIRRELSEAGYCSVISLGALLE